MIQRLRFMKAIIILCTFWMTATATSSCETSSSTANLPVQKENLEGLHKAYFASGCFWCVEAIFESIQGVKEAISGYSGGHTKNPTYESIGTGRTGHAEAVEVYYDTTVIDYPTLLKVFFGSHDPTTLNRQGPDAGTQYRSAIFYGTDDEKVLAENYIAELLKEGSFSKITTEVSPLDIFYTAEEYHQDYERRNPNQPYVRAVSIPRLKKFQKAFPELLKNEH